MKPIIKEAFQIISLELKNLKQYQLNFIGFITFLPVKLLVTFLVWNVLFNNVIIVNGFTKETIIIYYSLIAILEFMINPFCIIAYSLNTDIRSGKIDLYFSKPISYIKMNYFNKFGYLIIGYIYLSLVIIILSFIIDINIMSVILSFIFIILGSLILYLLFAIIGSLAFNYENILTLRDNIWNLIRLLSGILIPINFYPEHIKNIVNYLPFRYVFSFTVEVILGIVSGTEIINHSIILIIWVIILFIVYKLIWHKSIRSYSSQGG